MKRYERYKPSKVEWIGEIPEHWEVKKLKRFSPVKRGASPRPINDMKYFDENGEFAWVRISDVTASKRYLEDTEEKLSELGASLSVKMYPDQLFLSIAGSVGKPIITKIKCCIHDGFVYFPHLKINPEYWYYIFLTGIPFLGLGKLGTQLNLNTETVGNIDMPLPTEDEIISIVNYLDKKTTEIEELIADKENLISLLEQEKELTISNVVTKGLNPDMPMKDSKVEWIGRIPEHWDTLPIKFCTKIPVTDGPHETPEFHAQGIPFISAEAIKDDKINFEKIRGYISLEDHIKYSKKYKPLRNDIYMIKSGATTGNIAMVETDADFNIWSPLAVIRVNESIVLPKYAFYYMKSMNFFESVKLGWSYGTQQNIGMGVIENLLFCIPDNIDEQEQIVEFLDKKIADINEAVQIIKDEIELIKEYRETLIYEVVTGKVDVRAEL